MAFTDILVANAGILAMIFALVGGVQALLKIKMPYIGQRDDVAWAMFIGGILVFAGSSGMLSDFMPADQTSGEGGVMYSVSPAALSGASYSATDKAFSTTQTYNTTSNNLDKAKVKMQFSVSRDDQLAQESVYTAMIESNPTVENESTGETYKIFEETSDDKPKVKFEDSDGYQYGSRNFKLKAAGTNTFNVTMYLNEEAVDKGLNEAFESPYQSPNVDVNVAGQKYGYSQVLQNVVS